MANAKPRKLKVFQAQFGFYDTVIAARSQAAALRLWDTRRNLFATSEAKIVTDDATVKTALAHPETLLRRAVGTNDAFAVEPASFPKLPDALKKSAGKQKPKLKPAGPEKPPADRSKLDAAEKTQRDLDERRKGEEVDFRREEDELEARREAAQAAYVEARKASTRRVVEARAAYRKDGGKD